MTSKMNALPRFLALAACLASSWAGAQTTVLGFDDLVEAGPVPASYGGIDWAGSSWLAFGVEQAPYAAHSGTWQAATDFGSDNAASTIRFVTPSIFEGAWFSGYSDATVTVQMYLDHALVATSATLAPSAVPAFLASGYAGLVDQLVFVSPQQAFYAMDDFTFQAGAVPEPGAWLLMAGGLAVLVRRVHRRPSQVQR